MTVPAHEHKIERSRRLKASNRTRVAQVRKIRHLGSPQQHLIDDLLAEGDRNDHCYRLEHCELSPRLQKDGMIIQKFTRSTLIEDKLDIVLVHNTTITK